MAERISADPGRDGPAPDSQEQVERWLISTCHGLGLRVEDPGDDFFLAGGSSLTAVKLISQVEATFGEDALPPEDLFERSGVREIAASIRRHRAPADAPSAS